jgi:hypothetical protein
MTTVTVCYRTSTDEGGICSHPHLCRRHITSNLLRSMKVEHDFYKFEEFKWEWRQKYEIKLLLSPFVVIEWHFKMDVKLNSSVSTVNRILAGQLRNQGSISDRAEDFLHFTVSSSAVGFNQTFSIQWVPRTPSSGVKRKRSECDHQPPSNAEVKNVWRCVFTLSYVFVLINP